MHSFTTCIDFFSSHVEKTPQRPYLFYKKDGRYLSYSYQDIWTRAKALSHYLKQKGIKKGDTVAIIANNRPEWVIADIGILLIGAIVVPLYPTLSKAEVHHILDDAEVSCIIAELPVHVAFAVSYKNTGVQCEILSIEPHDECECLETVFSTIINDVETHDFHDISGDDVASIVYTSGTTGIPKGVMLTHTNFVTNVKDICSSLPLSDKDKVLSFLPLSHVFERTAGYYTVTAVGGQIYYAESITSVGDDLLIAQPTVLVSVPRLYEKIQSKIQLGLSGVKKALFYWALNLGLRCGIYGEHKPNFIHRILLFFANTLVYSKIKLKTGGHLRFFVSGGAPLGKELGNFFRGLGLLIIEGYGQTETSPVVACNRLDAFRMGSIGKTLPSVSVKLSDDGELLVKGRSVMKGYYKKETETTHVLSSDGWLHTGDIAEIDAEGFIYIVDRLKDIIVLSNGKKVSPQLIESSVLKSTFISQIVVTGENRNYITALIVPDFERFRSVHRVLNALSNDRLVSHTIVQLTIQEEIDRFTQSLSRYEKIKQFSLLPAELTQENGELTPTLKPKRKIIRTRYKGDIDSMYQKEKK
jgi:long-chain acyl-CoA synthetase